MNNAELCSVFVPNSEWATHTNGWRQPFFLCPQATAAIVMAESTSRQPVVLQVCYSRQQQHCPLPPVQEWETFVQSSDGGIGVVLVAPLPAMLRFRVHGGEPATFKVIQLTKEGN